MLRRRWRVVVESHCDVRHLGNVTNIISLYVDFVFAISLMQRNSHGRIRLPDTDTEAGASAA